MCNIIGFHDLFVHLVKNDAGQLLQDEEAKRANWKEHYECLLNVEFPWNPEDLSKESPVEGQS